MAQIKYQDEVDPISGHEGGVVFTSNAGRQVIRNLNSIVRPTSRWTSRTRGLTGKLGRRYTYDISPAQRTAWTNFGIAQGLSEGGGIRLYIQVNEPIDLSGFPIVDDPPFTMIGAEWSDWDISITGAPKDMTFETVDPNTEDNLYYCFATPPYGNSSQFNPSSLRWFMDVVIFGENSVQMKFDYEDRFGRFPVAGEKVSFLIADFNDENGVRLYRHGTRERTTN